MKITKCIKKNLYNSTLYTKKLEARHKMYRDLLPYVSGIEALAEFLFKIYTGEKANRLKINKLRSVRKKEKIIVVFQVWNMGKWKCDSVYRAMLQSPKFRPIIWILREPDALDEEADKQIASCISYFSKQGFEYTLAQTWKELDNQICSDVVFLQDPYVREINMLNNTKNRLLCYVRYCFPNTENKNSINQFLHNYVMFHFCENESIKNLYSTYMHNNGCNLVATGHPIVDYLMEEDVSKNVWKVSDTNIKKIIWAPHWAIDAQGPYYSSSFLNFAHVMIKIAQKYTGKVQFAFNPHPTLYRTLCEHPDWGKEKTDAYYRMWETMPNTQLETGVYRSLFQQSDAMIHNCGSFILEYLLMNKPCMYLAGNNMFPHFNEMNREALKCYTLGKDEEDIECFIQEQVLGGRDSKAQRRKTFCEEYLIPPHGKTAAQNIIDTILNH